MYAVIGLVVLLAIIGVVAFFIDRTRTARDGRVESENKLRPLTSIHGQDAFHLYTAKEKDKFASINESQYGQAAHSKRSSQANQSINRRLSSTHLTESVISDHSIYAASTSSTPSEHFMSSYISEVSGNDLNDSRLDSAADSFDLSHQSFEESFDSGPPSMRKSRSSVEF